MDADADPESSGESALTILAKLVEAGKLSQEKAAYYRSKYLKAQELSIQVQQSEQGYLAEVQRLLTQIDEERVDSDKRASDSQSTQQQISLLQIDYERYEDLLTIAQEQVAALEEEAAQLTEEKSRLAATCAEMEAAVRAEIVQKVEPLQQEIGELNATIAQYKAQMTELSSEADRLQGVNDDLDTVRLRTNGILTATQSKVTELARQPNIVQKQAAVTASHADSLSAQVKRLRDDIQAISESMDQQERDMSAMMQYRRELEKRLAEEEIRRQSTDTRVTTVEQKLRAARSEFSALTEERDANELQLAHTRVEITRREEDQQRVEQQCVHVGKKIRLAERERGTTQERIQELTVQIENANMQHRRVSDQIHRTERETAAVDAVAGRVARKVDDAREQRIHAETVSEAAEVNTKTLESDTTYTSQMLAEVSKELYERQTQRNAAAVEDSRLQAELDATMEKLRLLDVEIERLARNHETANRMGRQYATLYQQARQRLSDLVQLVADAGRTRDEARAGIDRIEEEARLAAQEADTKAAALRMEVRAVDEGTACERRLESQLAELREKADRAAAETAVHVVELARLDDVRASIDKDLVAAQGRIDESNDRLSAVHSSLADATGRSCQLEVQAGELEKAIERGTAAMRLADEAVGILNNRVNDLMIQVQHAATGYADEQAAKTELEKLRGDLEATKAEERQLAADISDPATKAWRALPETNAPEDERSLRQRHDEISAELERKKKQVLERQLVLEELTRLSDLLREKATSDQDNVAEAVQASTEIQGKLSRVTKSLQARQAEFILIKSERDHLAHKRDTLELELRAALAREAAGYAPTEDFASDVQAISRTQAVRRQVEREKRERQEMEDALAELPPGTIVSSAEPRPEAYIPMDSTDALPIPVPYGAFPPSKPQSQAVVKRTIKPARPLTQRFSAWDAPRKPQLPRPESPQTLPLETESASSRAYGSILALRRTRAPVAARADTVRWLAHVAL